MSQNLREHLSDEAVRNIGQWLTQAKYVEYKSELEAMIAAEQWKDLEDAFFKIIEFGTGGIRGTTGVGSNRINRVTIGEATQALCEYALQHDPATTTKGIAIACDTRLTSEEFSTYAAEVCAGNGVKAYLFESFRSTPELSFAVRHLGCTAGIVISASHNPPADNGFKAYWTDGGQLVPPHDKAVVALANKVEVVRSTSLDEAKASGLVEIIGKDIDDEYIAAVVNEAVSSARNVKIVYSPLHGAGQRNSLPVLKAAGFTDVSVVKAQMTPDGNFPTVDNGKPNPEEPGANDRAVAQMLAEDTDIAITNDPDADRIGVMVRQGEEPVYLNGNQSAVLAIEFAIRKLQEKGELTAKHYIGQTIVTTDMLKAVAVRYGVRVYSDMLIGFKYIGELIKDKEETDEIFIAGGEESYGLLKGTYARDKDGAAGALLLAEYAAELKMEGKTLYDRLLELYREYGLFLERLDSVYCRGAEGFKQMQTIMQRLRENPPAKVAGHEVTAILDYQTLKRRSLSNGTEGDILCNQTGNVVVLEFNNDSRCRITVRPSGTEPKIKLYVQWYEDCKSGDDKSVHEQTIELGEMLEGMSRELEGELLTE